MSPEDLFEQLSARIVPSLSPSLSEDGRKRRASSDSDEAPMPKLKKECNPPTSDDTDSDEDHQHSAPLVTVSALDGPLPVTTVFTEVTGRLGCGAQMKYGITIAELDRRMNGPENISISTIGGILRRAKAKNMGQELRGQLQLAGLPLPKKKRSQPSTLFTGFVEAEALHLAKDFDTLCKTAFPVDTVAAHLNQTAQTEEQTEKEKSKRTVALQAASSILQEIELVLQLDRSPIQAATPEVILPSPVQEGLSNFSVFTHGFGGPAVLTAIQVVRSIVDSALNQKLMGEMTPQNMDVLQALALLMQSPDAQQLLAAMTNV